MEVICGKRKDSKLYVYEGYAYNSDKRCPYIYRCAKRRTVFCSGVIEMKEEVILRHAHNHPSDPHIIETYNLKKEMIKISRESGATNKEIFDCISRTNPVAAPTISYCSVRSMLLREKLKFRPPLPQTICDYDSFLQQYDATKLIYKGYALSEDNKYCYIFSTNKLLKILEDSEEMFIDGTFSVSTHHYTLFYFLFYDYCI